MDANQKILKERKGKKITFYLFRSYCQKYYSDQEIRVDKPDPTLIGEWISLAISEMSLKNVSKESVISLAYYISSRFILHSFNTKYKLYFITSSASFFKTVVIFQLDASVYKVLRYFSRLHPIHRDHLVLFVVQAKAIVEML